MWDAMNKDLKTMADQKRELQDKLSRAQSRHEPRHYEDHEMDARLGKLKYQNEANRDQKAAMGRALGQKEVEIKHQQLEIDHIASQLRNTETKLKETSSVIGTLSVLRSPSRC